MNLRAKVRLHPQIRPQVRRLFSNLRAKVWVHPQIRPQVGTAPCSAETVFCSGGSSIARVGFMCMFYLKLIGYSIPDNRLRIISERQEIYYFHIGNDSFSSASDMTRSLKPSSGGIIAHQPSDFIQIMSEAICFSGVPI